MHLPFVLADTWPSSFDATLIAIYLLLVIALPVAGYVLLAVDIRAYYRSLRGALVLISNYTTQVPAWLTKTTWRDRHQPPCVRAFGLRLPYTEKELLDAYREQVKKVHPDHGGDRAEFLRLQRNFEEARSLITTQA